MDHSEKKPGTEGEDRGVTGDDVGVLKTRNSGTCLGAGEMTA